MHHRSTATFQDAVERLDDVYRVLLAAITADDDPLTTYKHASEVRI